MRNAVSVSILLGATLAASSALAETAAGEGREVDEVVVTATRSSLPANALPLTVEVIDKTALEQQVAISGSVVDAVSSLTPSFSPTRQKLSGAGETLRGRSPLYAINGIPQSTPLRDGSYAGEFTLEDPADNVTVSFVDANGAVVHTQDLGQRDEGATAFSWDGKNEAGETVAGGPLRMVVTATRGGQTSNIETATWTSIGGIQSPANGGESRLVTGLGLLTPDQAIRLA